MMLFLITFIVFSLAILGMGVGVLLGGRPIAGSCGRDCSCRGERDDSSRRFGASPLIGAGDE